MASGLSDRMERAMQELAPKVAALSPPKSFDATVGIDLSSAQNEVLRTELLEFFKTTVEDGLTRQAFALPPGSGGDPVLRQALAGFLNQNFNPIHPVLSEHVVLCAGASDALESAIHAICDEGDSVIVPGPYWYGLDSIFKARANVDVIVARPPTYKNYDNYLLPSLLAAYNFASDRSRIKAVVICNPHNPLSRCYPKRVLVECMEFCQERGLHLISDELYALTSLRSTPDDAPPFVSALSLTEPLVPEGAVKVDPSKVHVIWSASKLFGASGFRVGCIISQQNPQLCSAMALLTTSHTNNIASLYLSSLLSWSQLPTLLALNSERLTETYLLLAATLQEWDINYVTPTHGILLFARLGAHIRSVVEEKAFFNRLAAQGCALVLVGFITGSSLNLDGRGYDILSR